MRLIYLITFFLILGVIGGVIFKMLYSKIKNKQARPIVNQKYQTIKLLEPELTSETSVEEAFFKRRSIRDYKEESLNLKEISQLLWSAQGITDEKQNLRTAPSAGALYPLEVYLVAEKVKDLPAGLYKYNPKNHELNKLSNKPPKNELYFASYSQHSVKDAPVILVFSAVPGRTTKKYQERGIRYIYMEVGHAAQNVYLECVSLNLGTVVIGAFDDDEVKKAVGMQEEEIPLYLMPVGKI